MASENILKRNYIDNDIDDIGNGVDCDDVFCQKLYFRQTTMVQATYALITASQNILIQNWIDDKIDDDDKAANWYDEYFFT